MRKEPLHTSPGLEIFSELLRDKGFTDLFVFSNTNGHTSSYFQYPVRSDFFTIVFIEKGTFHFRLNLKDYYLKKNQIALAAPSALKQLVSISPGCTYKGIIFTPEYLAKTGMHRHRIDALNFFASGQAPVLDLTPVETESLGALLKQLQQKSVPGIRHPFASEILQYTFLIFIYEMAGIARKTRHMPRPRLNRKEELTVNFAMLVTKHFKEKRKVHEYADMLFITPKYLSEAVKDFTGKGAGELIDEVIVQEAKFLLLNPRLNIGQITEDLHFPDQSHFGKFFKHHTGLSPRAYRENIFK